MKRATKVHAHVVSNSAVMVDVVTVQECRPISKNKTWVLVAEGTTNSSVVIEEKIEGTE